MTKREMFDKLWIKDEWYMMGYDREQLYKSMTLKEVKMRYRELENGKRLVS